MSKNLTTGDSVSFTFEGVRFVARLRPGYSEMKTRIFVDLPEDADDTIIDNLMKRDRGSKNPEQTARKKASRGLALAALEAMELETKGVKYSRYAGCSSCACSPGFLFPERLGYSIYVTSVAELRARKDRSMSYAVESAKREVTKAKEAIRKAERELAKAERKVETSKEALKAHKAKRKEQAKRARAKARAAAKAAKAAEKVAA